MYIYLFIVFCTFYRLGIICTIFNTFIAHFCFNLLLIVSQLVHGNLTIRLRLDSFAVGGQAKGALKCFKLLLT